MSRTPSKGEMRMFHEGEAVSHSNNKKNNAISAQSPKYDNLENGVMGDVMATVPDWYVPPVKSDDELIDRWTRYFNECVIRNTRPTIEGLACAAGTTYKTLRDWETGKSKPTPQRQDIVERAKEYAHFVLASTAARNQTNPTFYIWYSKNRYEMQDRIDHTIEVKNNLLSSNTSADEVRQRVLSSIPMDDLKDFSNLPDIEMAVYEELSTD